MRILTGILAALALATIARADADSGSYQGWGDEGGQVFRSKVSVCRNHQHNERQVMVIVDDLPRKGARIGIQRFTVEYSGGEGSDRIVSAIHKKPYEYVLVPMYPVPQTPRMARVVLPQPRGVKATFRFYKFRHRNKETGVIEDGLVDELTRTFNAEDLEQLPVINPLRDPAIRKPRHGSPEEAASTPPPDRGTREYAAAPPVAPAADAPQSDAAPAGLAPAPQRDVAAPGFSGAPIDTSAISAGDPRLEMTRKFAARMASEERGEPAAKAAPEVGIADLPTDAPKLQYDEDTPEMKAAEARAAAMADRVRVQQAFQ